MPLCRISSSCLLVQRIKEYWRDSASPDCCAVPLGWNTSERVTSSKIHSASKSQVSSLAKAPAEPLLLSTISNANKVWFSSSSTVAIKLYVQILMCTA